MRVSNRYLGNVKVGPFETAIEAVKAPAAIEGNSTADVSTYVSSFELRRLVALALQEPEIRQHLLDELARRIADGKLLTPQSAQATADAILNADG